MVVERAVLHVLKDEGHVVWGGRGHVTGGHHLEEAGVTEATKNRELLQKALAGGGVQRAAVLACWEGRVNVRVKRKFGGTSVREEDVCS